MINPYIIGRWVTGPQFYGRERLIEAILHGPNTNFWIIGNRRIGKTSLLKEVERRTANSPHYLPLFWNMEGQQTEAEFAERLIEAIEDAQQYSPDTRWAKITLHETNSLRQGLRHLANWVYTQNLQLLLLCDETEALLYLADHSPVALQELRHVLQNHPNVRPVLASTRRLSLLRDKCKDWNTSHFLYGFAPYTLTNFRDETANQVITQAKSASPLDFEAPLLAEIRRATGNHPLLLQMLCSQLFEEDQVKLHSLQSTDLDFSQVSDFFQIDFDVLTPEEVKILHHISISACALIELEAQFTPLNVKFLLRNLIELGFLRQVTEIYEIGNLYLAEWLKTSPTQQTIRGLVTNQLVREVVQEQKASLHRQLITHYKALNHLHEQAAKFGLSIPTHIRFDIDEHISTIAHIEAELAELGENITSFQSPQSE